MLNDSIAHRWLLGQRAAGEDVQGPGFNLDGWKVARCQSLHSGDFYTNVPVPRRLSCTQLFIFIACVTAAL